MSKGHARSAKYNKSWKADTIIPLLVHSLDTEEELVDPSQLLLIKIDPEHTDSGQSMPSSPGRSESVQLQGEKSKQDIASDNDDVCKGISGLQIKRKEKDVVNSGLSPTNKDKSVLDKQVKSKHWSGMKYTSEVSRTLEQEMACTFGGAVPSQEGLQDATELPITSSQQKNVSQPDVMPPVKEEMASTFGAAVPSQEGLQDAIELPTTINRQGDAFQGELPALRVPIVERTEVKKVKSIDVMAPKKLARRLKTVSYTHLTLPTIYSV